MEREDYNQDIDEEEKEEVEEIMEEGEGDAENYYTQINKDKKDEEGFLELQKAKKHENTQEEEKDYEDVMKENKPKQPKEQVEEAQNVIDEAEKVDINELRKRNIEKQKLRQQQADKKAFEEAKRKFNKTNEPKGMLFEQVGAMLGYSKHGQMGEQIEKTRIARKKAEAQRYDDYIGALEEKKQKLLNKKDDEISNKDLQDINKLMEKIDSYQQEAKPLKEQVKDLELKQEKYKKFKYYAPTTTVMGVGKKGGPSKKKLNIYGQPIGTKIYQPKKKFELQFSRALRGVDTATTSNSFDKIVKDLNRMRPKVDDEQEVKLTTRKVTKPRPINRELGIEQWMVDL